MNVNPIARIEPADHPASHVPAISFADHLAAARDGLHICSKCYQRVDQVFQQYKCRSCIKSEAERFRHLFDKDRKV